MGRGKRIGGVHGSGYTSGGGGGGGGPGGRPGSYGSGGRNIRGIGDCSSGG